MQIEKYGKIVVYTMACFALGCMLNYGKSKSYEQHYKKTDIENIVNEIAKPNTIENESHNYYDTFEQLNKKIDEEFPRLQKNCRKIIADELSNMIQGYEHLTKEFDKLQDSMNRLLEKTEKLDEKLEKVEELYK